MNGTEILFVCINSHKASHIKCWIILKPAPDIHTPDNTKQRSLIP